MIHDDDKWNAVKGAELKGLIDTALNTDYPDINEQGMIIGTKTVKDDYLLSADTTEIHWRALSFYKNVVLIRMRDTNFSPSHMNLYFLADKGKLSFLNGKSYPIHEVNGRGAIKLSEDNVLDYVRFFCFFVRGGDGPFLICETMDSYGMPTQGLDESNLAAIEGVVQEATFEGRGDVTVEETGQTLYDVYQCNAIVYYGNAIYLSNFAVDDTGNIAMLKDDELVKDLPVSVDMPIA